MGLFFGGLYEHSSLVINFCHLSKGYISPQFHLVFDDLFETVIRTRYDESFFKAIFKYLFDLNRGWYAKDEHDDTGNLIY